MGSDTVPDDLDGAPVPVLRNLMQHDDPRVRGDAACAIGDRLRACELNALKDETQEAVAVLLNDRVPLVRLEAAIALAEAHDHRATTTLIGAARTRTYRLDAIRALGTLGDTTAIEPLLRMMQRWLMPWADKLQAAAALCALGEPQGQAYLVSKLDSRRTPERAAAIHFLGESKHPEALKLLAKLLADEDDPMRDVAARSFGYLGDPAAKPHLEKATAGADSELLEDIAESMSMLGRD